MLVAGAGPIGLTAARADRDAGQYVYVHGVVVGGVELDLPPGLVAQLGKTFAFCSA